MIAKLEKEPKEDAAEKAYCDEETAKIEARAYLEMGLGGVQKTLEVLHEYYGRPSVLLCNNQQSLPCISAGGSIIGILEVCQRFLKELGYDFLLLHSQMRTRTDPISLGSIGTFGIEDVWQHGSENENDDFAKIKGSRQRHDCQAT